MACDASSVFERNYTGSAVYLRQRAVYKEATTSLHITAGWSLWGLIVLVRSFASLSIPPDHLPSTAARRTAMPLLRLDGRAALRACRVGEASTGIGAIGELAPMIARWVSFN